MAPTNLHIYIDTDEEIHLFVHRNGSSDLFTGDLGHDIPADAPTTQAHDAVEAVYRRFENYDSTTPAREVGQQLSELGYVPNAPRHRDGSTTKSAYLRWTYKGGDRKVSLYMNSSTLVSDRDADRAFMSAQPGAVVRGAKARVHFPFATDEGPQDDLLVGAVSAASALRQDAGAPPPSV